MVAANTELMFSFVLSAARYTGFSLIIAGCCVAKRSGTTGMIINVVLALYLTLFMRMTGIYSVGFERYEGANIRAQDIVNPNTVGLLTLWGIVAVVYLWQTTTSRLIRLGLAATAVLLTLTLLSTGSRKSFLCLVVFVFLWVVFCYGRQVLNNLPAFLTVGVVVGVMFYVTVYFLPQTRLGERLEISEEEGLGRDRIGLYKEAFSLVVGNPVCGVGLSNFRALSSEGAATHSDFMEVMVGSGVVGFALYFSIYWILWRRVRRIRRVTNDPQIKYQMGVYQATVLTVLLSGVVTTNIATINNWLLLAIMIGHTCALDRFAIVSEPRPRRCPPSGRPSIAAFPHPVTAYAVICGTYINEYSLAESLRAVGWDGAIICLKDGGDGRVLMDLYGKPVEIWEAALDAPADLIALLAERLPAERKK